MAARFLPYGAAANMRERRDPVRADVRRQRQPFCRRADEVVSGGERRHADLCAHDRVMGLFLRLDGIDRVD